MTDDKNDILNVRITDTFLLYHLQYHPIFLIERFLKLKASGNRYETLLLVWINQKDQTS